MEEDIKTIQEKLKIIESLCTDDCINKSTVIQPLIYAIQNLIARYKELEEDLQNNKDYIKELQKKLTNAIEIKYIHQDYIPKSKVKEILNKLSNHTYKCNFDDVDFLQNIIIEIHQLLED